MQLMVSPGRVAQSSTHVFGHLGYTEVDPDRSKLILLMYLTVFELSKPYET
jgi:hypothetical protein